jgi:hypothetical protein
MKPYEVNVSMQLSALMLVMALRDDRLKIGHFIRNRLPQFIHLDLWFLFQYVQQCPCPVTEVCLVAKITDRRFWPTNDVFQLG